MTFYGNKIGFKRPAIVKQIYYYSIWTLASVNNKEWGPRKTTSSKHKDKVIKILE